MLAGLHEESVLAGLQVAEGGPGMCGSTWDVARPEVLGGTPRVGCGKVELVRRRLEERRGRLEPDLALLLVSHVRVFGASGRSPRAYCRGVDEALEAAKERAWREVAEIEAPLEYVPSPQPADLLGHLLERVVAAAPHRATARLPRLGIDRR